MSNKTKTGSNKKLLEELLVRSLEYTREIKNKSHSAVQSFRIMGTVKGSYLRYLMNILQ